MGLVRLLALIAFFACSDEPPLPPAPRDAAIAVEDGGTVDAGAFCAIDPGDGIACTADLCDEAAERIDHLPDDSRCVALDREATCGTGTAAGSLVEAIGICDPLQDCRREWRSIRDCRGPPRRRCAGTAIARDDPGCIAATSSCGAVTTVERDCADGVPADRCDGLTFRFGARAECSGDPPACTYSEQSEVCGARGPACSGGLLTTITAGCDPARGCTESSTTAGCFDPPSSCSGDVLTTYQPTCADASSCGAPSQTTTTCTGHTECDGRIHSVYAPACDPIGERCGEILSSATDCSYLDDCFCTGVPPAATQTIVTGLCTPQSGCAFSTSPPISCPTVCRCAPTRACN